MLVFWLVAACLKAESCSLDQTERQERADLQLLHHIRLPTSKSGNQQTASALPHADGRMSNKEHSKQNVIKTCEHHNFAVWCRLLLLVDVA